VRTLTKDRRAALIERVAAILKRAEPTPFALEAGCRHAIRSGLCLCGTSWAAADQIAADIVRTALDRIGARRPTWAMGQPEFLQFGVILTARTRCRHCGNRLPEENFAYCADRCRKAHARELYDDDRRHELAEAERLRVAVWRAAQPERRCAECSLPFQPNTPSQMFCGSTCASRRNWRFARQVWGRGHAVR
jgi:hypothetical protein